MVGTRRASPTYSHAPHPRERDEGAGSDRRSTPRRDGATMTLTHSLFSRRKDIGGGRAHLDTLATEAWRWWVGELAACVPAVLRRGLQGNRGRLLLIVDAAGDNLIEET